MIVCRAAVLVLLALAPPAAAQSVNLTETPKPGDASRITLDLTVTGQLIVTQEGRKQPLKLEAKGRHAFTARTLTLTDGLPARTVRHYDEASATATVGGERSEHRLPAERRLIVLQRGGDGPLAFSPGGPLTRDELDLVTEHFDPSCLVGLLPGRTVAVGDTWAVSPTAARIAGLFDSLIKNTLTGKFAEVKDGFAVFHITGTAEGIENGAKVTLTVDVTGKFHMASGRVVELAWKQADDREQGPVSPESKVEAVVTLKRETLAELPKELADAALTGLPADELPAAMVRLRFADPAGRYRFLHPRDWYVTGQTDAHLVLRLLDRGEFITQATVTAWKKAAAGQHATPEEFKKAIADSPGLTATKVIEDGELTAGNGRWLYRLTVEGRIEDQPIVQCFYLLAGPGGDQVVVTFSLRPERLKAVAPRAAELVHAIEFPAAKK